MILYLDSSNIVKLFLQEPDTAEMKRQAAAADKLASSRIAYAEVRSAFSRKRREGHLSLAEYQEATSGFGIEWRGFLVVEVTQPVVELAGDLCETHKLRGMDAIHMASAKLLAAGIQTPVRVSSSDTRLRAAAAAEGMA